MKKCILHTYALLLICLVSYRGVSQTYFLNGDATATGGDCYQLTTLSTYQNGTVWYADSIDLTAPFSIQFRMNLGNLDSDGADGICFVLQTVGTNAIGTSGGGMGYQNFGTSLGIEFDTYQNPDFNDPFYDHIAIEYDGNIDHNSSFNVAGPVQMSPFNTNTEDGQDHVVQINWNPSDQSLQVFFDCFFRLQGNIDLINTVFGGQTSVFWGFTAATGGLFNNQTVCLQPNILNVGNTVTTCPGLSAQLYAGASANGIYRWTPGTFLSDSTIANPIASPLTSTVYTVDFINLCGDSINAEITVNVEPLQVNIAQSNITCGNGTPVLVVNPNFSSGINYEWTTTNGQIISATNSNQITVSEPGWYAVEANIQNICIASDSIYVSDNAQPVAVEITEPIVINCNNENPLIAFTTDATTPAYRWFREGTLVSNAGTLSASVAGEYILQITDNATLCTGADTVEVTSDLVPPSIVIPFQDTLTCLQPIVAISGVEISNAETYTASWTTNNGHFATDSETLFTSVDSAGLYILTVVSNSNGCSAQRSVSVYENENIRFDSRSLAFPNVFSPNGDDKNAVWKPFLLDDPAMDISNFLTDYDVHIYNRWGSEVFSSNRSERQWRGEDAAEGVYFYTIQFNTLCGTGQAFKEHGNITLVR